MDVMKAIKERQSVRNYTGENISKADLIKLLKAAREAPSAKNLQPWELIVITDNSLKKNIVEDFYNQSFVADAGAIIIGLTEKEKWADIDLAIALDHLSLAATENGMGTCWLGAFKPSVLKNKLDIPDEYKITVCMAVGYPKNTDGTPVKKSVHELVSWNRYGNRLKI
ncbi:MAG: nitroreductase family protein [Candidatus Saliniplasma sp.]